MAGRGWPDRRGCSARRQRARTACDAPLSHQLGEAPAPAVAAVRPSVVAAPPACLAPFTPSPTAQEAVALTQGAVRHLQRHRLALGQALRVQHVPWQRHPGPHPPDWCATKWGTGGGGLRVMCAVAAEPRLGRQLGRQRAPVRTTVSMRGTAPVIPACSVLSNASLGTGSPRLPLLCRPWHGAADPGALQRVQRLRVIAAAE